jgi:SAM-dependent methyltransferase
MSRPENDPTPAEFDAYSGSYDVEVNKAVAFSGLTVDFFTRVKVDYLLDIIAERHAPVAAVEVLDVGCGIGNFHPRLITCVSRLAGVDVSAACIETARKRNQTVEYATYDGSHLPHPDNSFDIAYAVNVFHHVPKPVRRVVTSEVRRVLRPSGIFIIFEHNPWNPLTMHVVNNCEFDKDAVLLKRQEAEVLMSQAGFNDIESRFILTIPAGTRALRALDRLFSRVPLGAQYYTVGRRQDAPPPRVG